MPVQEEVSNELEKKETPEGHEESVAEEKPSEGEVPHEETGIKNKAEKFKRFYIVHLTTFSSFSPQTP